MNPLTMGVTMLGTAEVVMLAGGELRPAGREREKKKKLYHYWIASKLCTDYT